MTAKQIRENWESYGPKPAWVRRSNDILHPERSKARVLPDIHRPSYKGILLPRDPEPQKAMRVSFLVPQSDYVRMDNGMLLCVNTVGDRENGNYGRKGRRERRKFQRQASKPSAMSLMA